MLLYAAQDIKIHYKLLVQFLIKPNFYFMFYTYLIDVCFP